jgi:hypothetical protein
VKTKNNPKSINSSILGARSNMKSLKQYIAESAKEYEFRFKTIVELSEEQLDKFETHLRKYDAFDVGAPKRTILQTAPLDFYNTGATEVYMIDFKTRIPTSAAVLGNELGQCLTIGERDFRLRRSDEPGEILDRASMEDKEEGNKEALLNDPEMSEAEEVKGNEHAGQEFVDNFIDELVKSRKEISTEYKGKE